MLGCKKGAPHEDPRAKPATPALRVVTSKNTFASNPQYLAKELNLNYILMRCNRLRSPVHMAEHEEHNQALNHTAATWAFRKQSAPPHPSF